MGSSDLAQIQFLKIQKELTLTLAMEGKQLSVLRKENEVGFMQGMNNLFFNLTQSFNLTNSLNEFQVLELIYLVSEQFYFLKLEELILVFKNAKLGKYGKVYNRLDANIIFEWINKYQGEERAEHLEKINRAPDKCRNLEKVELSEEGKVWLKKINETLTEKETMRKVSEPVIVQRVTDEVYTARLKELLPNADNEILENLLKGYMKENWIIGVNLIKEELKKRK